MGLRLRGVILCGGCGKPRGLRHVCVRSMGRKTRRHRVQAPVEWECSTCHKRRGLVHTCSTGTDFKARKRQAATRRKADARRKRRKATAERRRERRRAAAAERRARDGELKRARTTRASSPRPRRESHEPGSCNDIDCPRYPCRVFFDGMAKCPKPHKGEPE